MIKQLTLLLKHHNLSLSSLSPHFLSSIKQTLKLSGLSNQSFKLIFTQSPPLAIKFYKNLFPQFVNRRIQSQVLTILNSANLIPQLYSNSNWGYSYKFIQGEQLTHKDLNKVTLNRIVDAVIDMTMIVESSEQPEEPEQMRKFENVVNNCRKIWKEMEGLHPEKIQINKQLISDMLNQDVINNILKILPEESIFSHNDVNLTNLIKTDNGLILMDYEFACQNYIGFDLGNLFNQITTEYSDKFEIKAELEIDENIKRELVWKYFELLERDPKDMMRKVEIGRLLSHHFWFFIGLLSFNDPHCRLDLNYYLKRRHQQFFKYYKTLCLY